MILESTRASRCLITVLEESQYFLYSFELTLISCWFPPSEVIYVK